jgi:uncharacterized protein
LARPVPYLRRFVATERSQLIVRLNELPLTRRVELGVRFVSDAVGDLPLVAALEGSDHEASDAAADVEIYAAEGSAEDVFLRGKLTGHLMVACGRCVDPVKISLSEDLAVSFLPAARVPDDNDDELEITEDDVDVYPYEGESLDLTTLFRERLIMAVPYAPLCREDCKGLCTVCGADLNSGECGCDRHVGDPRLAALRDLAKS